MQRIIAACGNDCAACPRYLPRTDAELERTAQMWYDIGYRDRVCSKEEISCAGCKPTNSCRYKIISCTTQKGIATCGECDLYPCDNIRSCLEVTKSFIPACRKACTAEEYAMLERAFFEKKQNLDRISIKRRTSDTTRFPERIKSLVGEKKYTVNDIGMSGGSVYIYDDMVLKAGVQSAQDERCVRIMQWLDGKLPVPRVICCESSDGFTYLLMSRIKGRMSCDEHYMNQPELLVRLLAECVDMLWRTDISDCPVTRDLSAELADARARVENGLADTQSIAQYGFSSPLELLEYLEKNRPSDDPVFSHGDLCLPNIFFDDDHISGFIDLGDAGIADRYRDLALLARSLRHNSDGTYGKVFEGITEEMLFSELGISPDREKMRYYLLLDELYQ